MVQAIIVPFLILLLCGIIDFGLIFGGYLSMEAGRFLCASHFSPTRERCSTTANNC
jgi:TadE-like protein